MSTKPQVSNSMSQVKVEENEKYKHRNFISCLQCEQISSNLDYLKHIKHPILWIMIKQSNGIHKSKVSFISKDTDNFREQELIFDYIQTFINR